MPDYSDLFARRQTSTSRCRFDSMLPAEARSDLDQFFAWLQSAEGKTEGTARSYRTNVSKCMALPDFQMTSDHRSAIAAFERFIASR